MASNGYKPRRIPVNVTDSGRCLNGLLKTRNLVEGGILAAPIALLVWFCFKPDSMTLKIQVMTVSVGLPFALGVVGIPPYSLLEFIAMLLNFKKTKHYAKYNPRLKWETTPDFLAHPLEEPLFSQLVNSIDLLLNRETKKEDTINENIINPTHDEHFIEDEELLYEQGLTPDELKTPAQRKAETKVRKREAKEEKRLAKQQMRAAKAEAKANLDNAPDSIKRGRGIK